MIEHIVLFKFKSGVDPEKVETMLSEVRGLISIPGVISITAGQSLTDRHLGFTSAAVIRIKDLPSLEKYRSHEKHKSVLKNVITPITEQLLVVDYNV